MSNEGVNTKRRRFLTIATGVVGAGGAAAAAVPFLASMAPSERAKALGAPVTVNVENLSPGQMITTSWRGKPVWVVSRTPEMLDTLDKVQDELRDPNSEQPQQPPYAQNASRAIKPEKLVIVGVCTHLGCAPKFRPEKAPADLGDDWLGGFFCPCHGSKFDLAGRVYQGVPAPLNLPVPPHRYVSENEILVGEDPKESA